MHTGLLFECYNCQKVQNYYEKGKLHKVLYKIKSPKTNFYYLVFVEFHEYNLIFIKFHLKSNTNSPYRFNLLSNLNEARPIIFTCLNILKEYVLGYEDYSFGVVGASTVKLHSKKKKEKIVYREPLNQTKRFKVYKRLFINFVSEENFEHYEIPEKSVYLVIRKSSLEKNTNLLKEISEFYSNYNFNI